MISRFDMNLFFVFQTLMEERSVTKAANRLGKTQSAISNALKRLRESFNDPLFVRTPEGLVPTPRAEQISIDAENILAMAGNCLKSQAEFIPSEAEAHFTIGAPDRLSLPVFLPFFDQLAKAAPGISVELRTTDREFAIGMIENHEIDLALGWFDSVPARVNSQMAFVEPLVCLMRKAHPMLEMEQPANIDQVLSFPHLVVSSAGDRKAAFDAMLARVGRSRHALTSVSNFTLVPELLRSSEMIGVFTQRTANYLAEYYGLATHPLPLDIEPIEHHMIWHHRYDHDRLHLWMRNRLLEQCVISP